MANLQKGLITTRWEKAADRRFSLSVAVLPNTRAAIYIPKLSAGKVSLTESGKVLWPANPEVKNLGVLEVVDEGSVIKYLVGAGKYRFVESPLSL